MIDLQQGDCLELMKDVPDKSIDMVITSPPYFNLRDYDCDGQLGQEETEKEYIDNLINIFNEVYRVLKDKGSCWVNIDDVYSNQSLMCIPDKFKIQMVNNGWICRNEIIWHKPNAMPSSAKTRFNNDYEKLFFFTKNKKYVFNTQYEPLISKQTNNGKKISKSKYKNEQQEASVRQGMTRARGTKIIALRKNLPSQTEMVNFLRSKTSIEQIAENSNIKRSKIEHWFRRDESGFAYPSAEDWNSIKWLFDDWSEQFKSIDEKLNEITYETDDILKNAHNGRIKRAIWTISTKAFKGYHYATFPEELVKTPIIACTNESDTVLDIFCGSGTTGVACKKLNRNFIGMELNKEFCNIAKERIEEVQNE